LIVHVSRKYTPDMSVVPFVFAIVVVAVVAAVAAVVFVAVKIYAVFVLNK
jgi:hypothetical protein